MRHGKIAEAVNSPRTGKRNGMDELLIQPVSATEVTQEGDLGKCIETQPGMTDRREASRPGGKKDWMVLTCQLVSNGSPVIVIR